MKIELLIAAIILLGTPVYAQFALDTAQFRVILTRVDPIPVEAGGTIDVWITLRNGGSKPAENFSVAITDSFPFRVDPSEPRETVFGKVEPGEQVTLKRTIRVDKDAFDGDAKLRVRYSAEGARFITEELKINIEAKHAMFATGILETQPENLFSDTDDNRLSVGIANVGDSDAKLVRVELNLPKGFKPSKTYSNIANLGNIPADISVPAVFFIDIDEDVIAGEYNGFLAIEYKEESDDEEYKRQTLNLAIPVRAKPEFAVELVETEPTTIGQGEQVKMKIGIRNTGLSEAESVSIRGLKSAAQDFEFDENFQFIGDLKANQTGEGVLKFTVDSDAPLKEYLLNLEIRFTDDDTVQLETETVGFRVSKSLASPVPLLLGAVAVAAVIAGAFLLRRRKR